MNIEKTYIQVNFWGSQVDTFESLEAYKKSLDKEKAEAFIYWDDKLVLYIENKYKTARIFEVTVTSKEIII